MTNRRSVVVRGDKAAAVSSAFSSGSIASFDTGASVPRNALEAAQAAAVAATEKGYNDGLEAARRDVEALTEDSNKRVRRALAALSSAVDEFDQRQTVALADVETAIVSAALDIARSILQREISVAADPGAEAIARALAITPGRDPAIVRINPDDAATLNLTSVPTAGRSIDVIADPAIEPGGCIVQVGSTSIDSQISASLANVSSALGL